jgi:hypothetical protein
MTIFTEHTFAYHPDTYEHLFATNTRSPQPSTFC